MQGDDLLTGLAIGGVLALVAAVGVHYLVAQTAALVFAHRSLPVPMSDAGAALAGMPDHLGDPAAAWPAAAQAALPGPVGYYACLALVLAIAAAAGLAGLRLWRAARVGRHPLGVAPNAGFARARDVKRLTVAQPTPGRLTLGQCNGRLLACEPQASLAIIGPTGCGKTAGFAIPALLEWKGPVIATSVKADLLAATIAHRRRQGTVWVYDPTRSSGFRTSAWSPLEACGSWAGALRIAAWLSEAAQPRLDSVSDGDYWYSQAKKGLAPYLYAAASSGRRVRDLVRWIDSQDENEAGAALRGAGRVEERVAELVASEEGQRRMAAAAEELRAEVVEAFRHRMNDQAGGRTIADRPVSSWPQRLQERVAEQVHVTAERQVRAEAEAEAVARFGSSSELAPLVSAQALWGKEARLRSSVYATMENVLSGYADPGVAEAADRHDIDLDAWLGGDNTIYVVATAHEQARLRPVLTVLVQQAIRAAYDSAAANGGTLARPCLALLDEAGNIAPLRDLPSYASTARSHGITIVSIWQDLAQIRAIYHDRAPTVLNNHRAKLFGTGISDQETLEYVSRLIGDEPLREQNRSADLHGGRESISEHTTYRRAAPADVLRRLDPNESVLVYGSELPARVRLRPWFRDKELTRLGPKNVGGATAGPA
jgi:type IV secretion system protein VirD4